MALTIYVDGSGGPNSGYGYFVKDPIDSFYAEKPDLTSNQAEYHAIISALKKYAGSKDDVIVCSDSQLVVNQLNHKFAINNDTLRKLAQEAWAIMSTYSSLTIKWIPRKENWAGKMLGS